MKRISLDEHWTKLVEDAVEDGRFRSAEDVVTAGLRLMEERDGRLRALKDKVADAIARGGAVSEPELDALLVDRAEALLREGL
ncbi:type II toxin-antitoxin system ParD family antitoxin [Rhizobium sp. TRM95796]|uniref:type II toxin-antitoxin system ParD family antitoxin n=1 Tax=Rhizobium sp. TRM95796 TaxID=2979862 RepID=UPI0021E92D22|nr:type II toxin-antitoxin system ParD family antitoxin [Rhizobium sp. TRM95796]MCV3765676.1 type II toxin-antitoxin system ParD family antitoxin [Rhizobium sp. TRM95796]